MARSGFRIENAAYSNTQRLNDELHIAQRSTQKRGTWYLLKLGIAWPRRSLGTIDLKTARSLAYDAYRIWQADPEADWLAAIGSTKHHVSFKTAAEDWLKAETLDKGYKADVIRKFLVPYFDTVRSVMNIAEIDDAMIADYKVWRLNFWKDASGEDAPAGIKSAAKQIVHFKQPSANTLNREYPTLRQILKYAGKKGYFGTNLMPDVATEASKPNPRRALLGDDFDTLAAEAEKWVAEAGIDSVRWSRRLLADWIWIGRHTGLRLPHEAGKLTWGDIRLDTNLLHVSEDTKTGKRDVPLNANAAGRLKEMRERRKAHAKKAKPKFAETEHVFVMQNGKSFRNLGKLFNQLVERCKFPQRSGEPAYVPYSLRHTFATFALAEGNTSDHVAEMMGTSPKMLKEHYQHGTIEQTRRYLLERGLMPTNHPGLTPSDTWKPLNLRNIDDLPLDHPDRRIIGVIGFPSKQPSP